MTDRFNVSGYDGGGPKIQAGAATLRAMDESSGFDPKRRLCPDGACTGVLGRDGRCTECGRLAGEASGDATATVPSDDIVPLYQAAAEPEGDPLTSAPANEVGDRSAFDPARRLCDDGTCVGVIGAKGACTVCGRVAS